MNVSNHTNMTSPETYYNVFIDKLTSLRTRELIVVIFVHLFKFLSIFGIVACITTFTESILWFPAQYRSILSISVLLCGIGLFIIYGRAPVCAWLGKDKRYSIEALAQKLGNTFPEIKDRLLNALQVFTYLTDSTDRYSADLIKQTISTTGKAFAHYDFNRSVDYSALRRQSWFLSGFIVIAVVIVSFMGSQFTSGAYRLVHPFQEFPLPASFVMQVSPGNSSLLRSDPFTVRASTESDTHTVPSVYIKYESVPEFEPFLMIPIDEKNFTYTVDHIRESLEYYVRRSQGFGILKRKISSPRYSVRVINRPAIKTLKVHLDYPPYSRLASRFLDDNIGDITALKGTRTRIELTFNKPVARGAVKFSNGLEIPLTVRDVTAEALFMINQDVRYTIRITDRDSISNSDPIEYRISAIQDAYPFIQITTPREQSDLTEDRQTLVGIKVSDDFGVTRLRVGYKLLDRNAPELSLDPQNLEELLKTPQGFAYTDIPLPNKSGTVQDIFFLWNLNTAQIFPEDRILYFTELYDNDIISGPKCSLAPIHMLRLPSVQELFNRAADVHEKQTEALSEVIQESKELQQELTELSHNLLETKELNWEQKQKAEEAIKKQEDLQKQVEAIKKEIDKLVNTFEQNDLISAETLDKYKELQDLLEELSAPTMKELLPKLRESLKNAADMNLNRQTTENLRQAQQDYIERIERTLAILRRLQIDQLLDEAIIKTEKITETQQHINAQIDSILHKSKSEQTQPAASENLAQEETALSKNADNLSTSLQRLLEKMGNFPDISSEKVGSASDVLEEKKLSEKMRSMSRELSQLTVTHAWSTGKTIEQDLSDVKNSLKQAQKELNQQQKENILNALRKSTADLLELSNNQELTHTESTLLTPNSDKFRTIAEKQFDILSGLGRVISDLSTVSEKTFAVPMQLRLSIVQALNAIRESLKQLEARNKDAAIAYQNQSLSALNESIAHLLQTSQNVQSSNTGMGFDEFMKQMEQLASMQEMVNQKTQGLAGGSLSPEQQALLQRIAQDQEIIRKSIEQLQREMQGKGSIEQRLNQMNNEMQEVTKNLNNKTITERTLELQERILSRMLDAQRSVNRRDFSNKRTSETAKSYEANDPGALPASLGEHIRILDAELMKALQEGYTRDFETVIKQYFENLNKQNIQLPIKKE